MTTVVQIAAQTGAEIQSRQRTNNFLDKMNEELFRPAGLYAMIVKYKSDREVAQSGDNLLVRLGVSGQKANLTTSEIISKFDRSLSDESASRTMGQRMAGMRLASDTTKGSMAMPAAAPLIFPEIDAAVAVEGEQTFKEKAKDYHGFLADYMDKRAQVKYVSSPLKPLLTFCPTFLLTSYPRPATTPTPPSTFRPKNARSTPNSPTQTTQCTTAASSVSSPAATLLEKISVAQTVASLQKRTGGTTGEPTRMTDECSGTSSGSIPAAI